MTQACYGITPRHELREIGGSGWDVGRVERGTAAVAAGAHKMAPWAVRIYCPKCGRIGDMQPSDESAGNDNEDLTSFVPPEGFRKVVIGYRSADVYLFCVSCGVAAHLNSSDN